MLRIIFSCLFFLFLQKGLSQEIPLTPQEKKSLDSMFNNDEFFKILNEKSRKSYFDLSAGVSNGIFSLKNNSLNAAQTTTNKLYYTPAVGYFHKSGFGISATGFLASDVGQFKLFQFAISPGYIYSAKYINAGISYTRYLTGTSTSFDVNPFQNDLYGNIMFKKLWIRPAIGVGYSSGRIKEYLDSVISFVQPPRTITIRDTITTRISSFSMNLSISHSWSFRKVIFKNDGLELMPVLMVNGSNQRLAVKHSGISRRRPQVQNLLKTLYGDGVTKSSFSLQSMAALLSVSYGTGKFLIQPQLYLDYYLRDTDGKKMSFIYSFVISYMF